MNTSNEYWDNLFQNRDKAFPHEHFLEEDIKYFKHGKLLDLGCGDGRNVDFFIENGFEVTCIDYSKIGIDKIKLKAKKHNLNIETYVMNTIDLNYNKIKSKFDTVTMIHYFPGFNKLEDLVSLLNIKGVIYCTTFIKDYLEKNTSKFEIGISLQEIELIKSNYILKYEKNNNDSRGYIYTFVIQV